MSDNWSGYALNGSGPYESVSASWTQPALDCTQEETFASFWVGLDGDSTTAKTVEQTGTEGTCYQGSAYYIAWYELYPRWPVYLGEFTGKDPVLAGDSFTASVTHLGSSRFMISLSDTTQGWSYTRIKTLRKAGLLSAEAIVEAPWSEGPLPLADFGTLAFSGMTVNGSLVTGSTPGLEPISMIGSAVEAEPSPISSGGFSDTWHSG